MTKLGGYHMRYNQLERHHKFCSECGKGFYINSMEWTYKYSSPKVKYNIRYQCTYSCHKHALKKSNHVSFRQEIADLKTIMRQYDKMLDDKTITNDECNYILDMMERTGDKIKWLENQQVAGA